MKTDQAVYAFLSTGAEAFRVLSGGLRLRGPYRFRSVTFKALERRADGVFEPAGPSEPVFVVEFQAVYLNRFLPLLLEQEPDNPFVAVFAPLVIERDEVLRAQAPRLWQAVQSATLPQPVRDTLSEVMEFWFFERFQDLTPREIAAMLSRLTPLEETRAYREIFAEGRARGETEGKAEGKAGGKAEGKADSLMLLLDQRFGPLPGWANERIAAASTAQIDTWLNGVLAARDLESLIGNAPSDGR